MFKRVTAKYNGRYYDYPIDELDVVQDRPVDNDIRVALAQRIATDVAAEQGGEPADHLPDFNGFDVDPPEAERLDGRHDDKEVLTVRPSAEYGCCSCWSKIGR